MLYSESESAWLIWRAERIATERGWPQPIAKSEAKAELVRSRAGGYTACVINIGHVRTLHHPDEAALEREWATLPRDIEYFPSYNFAPTLRGPVIIDTDEDHAKINHRQRAVTLMTWGFQPHWAKRTWINARAETIFENRAFARDAECHRCLVIAAGWYEWTGDKAPRQPRLFRRKDGYTLAFAGIWTNRKVDDDWVSTYAILTTDANDLSAPIHDRMPLIVHPLAYDAWLSPQSEPQDYRTVLEGPGNADAEFEVYPVSKAVNSPKNDSPELVTRLLG